MKMWDDHRTSNNDVPPRTQSHEVYDSADDDTRLHIASKTTAWMSMETYFINIRTFRVVQGATDSSECTVEEDFRSKNTRGHRAQQRASSSARGARDTSSTNRESHTTRDKQRRIRNHVYEYGDLGDVTTPPNQKDTNVLCLGAWQAEGAAETMGK